MRIIIEIEEGKVSTKQVSEPAEEETVGQPEGPTYDAGEAPHVLGDETALLAESGEVFEEVVTEYPTATMEGESGGEAPTFTNN